MCLGYCISVLGLGVFGFDLMVLLIVLLVLSIFGVCAPLRYYLKYLL